MSKNESAIVIRDLEKSFKLPHEQHNGIKQRIINIFKGVRGYETQKVLNGVSFEIKKGEFFGIVGRNGSGKSTLLKLLAGIYTPDKGLVQVNGNLTPFIELGVGFNPELTGRENVFLNGALLGFSKHEMDKMYDSIVSFAEIEQFMDQKLKNYSSGMQVRLAFSIAIRANTDILVLDEVLAVGDEAFQRKCEEYFIAVKKRGKTIVLVTHSMENVRRFCDRALLLDKGKIVISGNPNTVAGRYSEIFQQEHIQQKQQEPATKIKIRPNSEVNIRSIDVMQDNKKTNVVGFRKDFILCFNIQSNQDFEDLVMGVHLVNQSGQIIVAISTKLFEDNLKLKKGKNIFKFYIQNILAEGNYSMNFAIKQKTEGIFLVQENDVIPFAVIGIDASKYNLGSVVYPDVRLRIE